MCLTGEGGGWAAYRRAQQHHATPEPTYTGINTLHPQPCGLRALPGQSGFPWALPLTRGGSCLASDLRPTAQSPGQLCLLIGTQEQGQLHHRGSTLFPLAPGTSWWDFIWPLTLHGLTPSFNALSFFSVHSHQVQIQKLDSQITQPSRNNVTGPAPPPTNYGISHISKPLQRTMPCDGRGRFSCAGMEKNQILSQQSPNEITMNSFIYSLLKILRNLLIYLTEKETDRD